MRRILDQTDRAGLLVIGGFLCCERVAAEDASTLTERDYRIMHDSATASPAWTQPSERLQLCWSDTSPCSSGERALMPSRRPTFKYR